MADVRNFRSYIEELSGNNLLKKQIATLERANTKLEHDLKDLKEEVKLLKKHKDSPLPKKKGRKPRTMLQIIEAEMGKRKDRSMKVTDIVKMLKKKKFESKASNIYASVAASLNNSDKFVKASPGVYQIVAEGAAKPAAPAKKKAPARKKPVVKEAAAPKSAAKKPAKKKRAVKKAKAKAQPVTAEAAAPAPAVKKPAVKKPAVKKAPARKTSVKKAPAKKKPAKKKSAAAKKLKT